LVTFSAHWCGPCKASKPQLEALAQKWASQFKIGIAYESDLDGDDLHGTYKIRAFPTYVVYAAGAPGRELDRVEGVNLQAVEQLVEKHRHRVSSMPTTGGESLGGAGASSPLSPAEARAARLAKLGGGGEEAAAVAAGDKDDGTDSAKEEDGAAAAGAGDLEMKDAAAEEDGAAASADAEMAAEDKNGDGGDRIAKLDPQALDALTSSMGFSLLRAQKGLLYGQQPPSVESAVEWLMQHQDDVDIDAPIPEEDKKSPASGGAAGGVVAQSYRCNDCGKVLSNMANLELHANKTGHSDFEESTESVVPLTAEEKTAKIAEIKELLKEKRAEREEKEKEEEKEREKQRRFMGKEMLKTREQLEMEQRKREAMLRKKEKEEFKKERARLRAELERDKAERKSHQGKLSTKLGVEGYNPSIAQYDVEGGDGEVDGEEKQQRKKKAKADVARIDEYITKISSYRAGGDGGKCLKVLKAYVGNVVDNPDEEKFRSINMDNKAFKTKVKPFVGAKNLLMAVGFQPNDVGDALVLVDDADPQVLVDTKEKLEKALVAYG